jgi:hypothetical protein
MHRFDAPAYVEVRYRESRTARSGSAYVNASDGTRPISDLGYNALHCNPVSIARRRMLSASMDSK